jgi:nitroreductase
MDAQECMLRRQSVRKYNDRRVTEEEISNMLQAAIQAPSGGDTQPWRFAILRDELLEEFRKKTGNDYFGADCVFVVYVEHTDRPFNRNRWAPVDNPDFGSGFAGIQNILLSAHAMGLGTCWCKPLYPATITDALKKHFDIRENHTLLATITVGGYDDLPPKAGRRPISDYLLKPKA